MRTLKAGSLSTDFKLCGGRRLLMFSTMKIGEEISDQILNSARLVLRNATFHGEKLNLDRHWRVRLTLFMYWYYVEKFIIPNLIDRFQDTFLVADNVP